MSSYNLLYLSLVYVKTKESLITQYLCVNLKITAAVNIAQWHIAVCQSKSAIRKVQSLGVDRENIGLHHVHLQTELFTGRHQQAALFQSVDG